MHGRKHTNYAGCKGPLCAKAGRDAGRMKHRRRRARLGMPVKTERYVPTWEDIFIIQFLKNYEAGRRKGKS